MVVVMMQVGGEECPEQEPGTWVEVEIWVP
jgi:hypothetical protein